ncbi:MAG: pyridoxamine 5'-phosphate oxidase [Dehalococcoidia bacterium]|nr:pyridoxamine 5'-phosphate oxidase [Dehalococcoidia bacterium]
MTWAAFAEGAPDLATFARERLHGRVAYVATATREGAPRVHPVTPIIDGERLFLFMEPTSPKGHDLRHNPRYALHCSVEDSHGGGGEVFLRGRAEPVEDPALRALAVAAASYEVAERYVCFTLSVEQAVATRYTDAGPARERWRAD